MTKERRSSTAEHHELRERLAMLGIKVAVFDLDDTVWDLSTVFYSRLDTAIQVLADASGLEFEEMRQRSRAFLASSRAEFQTRPARMVLMPEMMARWCQIEDPEIVATAQTHIEEIYTTDPVAFPGAEQTLDIMNRACVRLAAVTHADADWTEAKLHATGFRRYFDDWRSIDPAEPKGPEQWQSAFRSMDVTIEHTLVVGDNPQSDIQSARAIGVPYTVLVLHGKEPPNTPDGDVVLIDQIDQLIPRLLDMKP